MELSKKTRDIVRKIAKRHFWKYQDILRNINIFDLGDMIQEGYLILLVTCPQTLSSHLHRILNLRYMDMIRRAYNRQSIYNEIPYNQLYGNEKAKYDNEVYAITSEEEK